MRNTGGVFRKRSMAAVGLVVLTAVQALRAEDDSADSSAAPDAQVTLVQIRQVIDQARQLAERLQPLAELARLEPSMLALQQLENRLAGLESGGAAPAAVQEELYRQARRLARQIAFSNPRLDFDKLTAAMPARTTEITRHDARIGPGWKCRSAPCPTRTATSRWPQRTTGRSSVRTKASTPKPAATPCSRR
jgi:TolA-binding protein